MAQFAEKWRLLGALAVFAPHLTTGCGNTASTGPDEVTVAEDLAVRVVQRYCEHVSQCCDDANIRYAPVACAARQQERVQHYFYAQIFPGALLDPAGAQRCLDGVDRVTQGCVVAGDFLTPDCEQLFDGTVPLGETCDYERGCARANGRATYCDLDGDRRSGTCLLSPGLDVPAHAKAGDACELTCSDEASCLDSCNGGACDTVPPCYGSDQLYCSEEQVCVTQGDPGALPPLASVKACLGQNPPAP